MGIFHFIGGNGGNSDNSSSIFGGGSSSSNSSSSGGIFGDTTTCPALPSPVTDALPISGTLTFTTLAEYISGIATAVAVAGALLLIILHATHLSRPAEQIKIMRVIALIPTFALLAFGQIFLGVSAPYLAPWMNVCESISIWSFYSLLNAYLDADSGSYSNELQDPTAPFIKPTPAAPVNTGKQRLFVLQYFPVALLVAVVQDGTEAAGVLCLNSNSPHFAHIWLMIIRTLSVALAVITVLNFTKSVRSRLAQHHVMTKLVGFKLIVLLNVAQTLIFSFAGSRFTPTATLSYIDLTVGIPAILLCCEMVIFAAAFPVIYRFGPYTNTNKPYEGGPLGIVAFVTAFNPVSVLMDFFRR